MWAYSHAAFRMTALAPPRIRLEPGTIVLVTHRRESDVPVLCPELYRRAALWRRRAPAERLSFAARDDLFLPGFVAGFPPGLSPRTRRVLFPVAVGRWLPLVQVYPIRNADVARLGEVLRARKDDALADVLAPGELDAFHTRAAACGLRAPVVAGDALRGEYADLLWRFVSRGDAAARALDRFWSGRAAQAAGDFRALVEIVRSGGILVVFPEGRPSPDGELGPIQRGIAVLVRRARPNALVPAALAYDPLTRGRTRAVVSIGAAVAPPAGRVAEEVLALLRRTMPLTVGQIVADLLERGMPTSGVDVERAALAAVATASADGRPVEPDLLQARRRAARLAEALAVAPSRPAAVAFLARELASARETV
jgi:hypothetical protein